VAQNRNQHFVPQFYLRNFSTDGRSISVFNLASRTHYPSASIKGQASRSYFYGKDAAIENASRAFENAGADALRVLLQTDQPPAKGSERAIGLLSYIMFQLQRTPAAGIEMEEMATAITKRTFQGHPEIRQNPELLAALKDVRVRYRSPVLNAIKIGVESAPVLFDMESKLLVNRTGLGFVTSDVAVVMHNRWCEGLVGRGTTGFASRGLLIVFPVSPGRLLLFYDGTVYKVGDPGERLVQVQTVPEVEVLNRFQFLSAHQNLYYQSNLATASSIDAMTGARAPRYERVLSERAVSEDENESLVHLFHAPLPIKADLPWLHVNQAMKRVKPVERMSALRSEARKMAAFVRGPFRRPPARPGGAPRSWTVVPDSA
jgi:hypothetical protein